jgi:hypothetical protein
MSHEEGAVEDLKNSPTRDRAEADLFRDLANALIPQGS